MAQNELIIQIPSCLIKVFEASDIEGFAVSIWVVSIVIERERVDNT